MRAATSKFLNLKVASCVGLAAWVFSCRAWLILTWGSPLPFWDQWDAELIALYSPWLKGSLHWADLFRPHNEHRIVLTRLTDLVLFWSYGTWNPWAQLILNALLHAGTAAMLTALFWRVLPLHTRSFYFLSIAVLFSSACGWQNALYGFQSHVYFANLLTVVAVAGLCTDKSFGLDWWLGLIAAALALFSNGGGVLTAIAILIVQVGYRRANLSPAGTWITSGAVAGLVVVALLLSTEAPQHATFQAKTFRAFIGVVTSCMAWPWLNFGVCCLITQLPLIWLIFDRWRKRLQLNCAERCALTFGLCAVLQAVAIAYTRGAALPESRPISRYQDPLLLGVVGQLFAVTQIFVSQKHHWRIAGLVWCGVMAGGLIGLTGTNFSLHLPFKRAQDRANLAIVREYASTGDFSAFTRDPNFSGPHPDPRVVQRILDDPQLRAIVPADVLTPANDAGSELPWIIRYSPLCVAISGVFLVALTVMLFRSKSDRPHLTMSAQFRPD